jgi:hypothetical protein
MSRSLCLKSSLLAIAMTVAAAPGFAGEQEALSLASAMGMEQRWAEKITGPAIERYVARLRDVGTATVPEAEKTAHIESVRAQLQKSLSWERVGRNAVIVAYSNCDDQTLADMRRTVLKEDIGAENRERTVASFKECTKNSDAVLNDHLSRGLQTAFKELDAANPKTVR